MNDEESMNGSISNRVKNYFKGKPGEIFNIYGLDDNDTNIMADMKKQATREGFMSQRNSQVNKSVDFGSGPPTRIDRGRLSSMSKRNKADNDLNLPTQETSEVERERDPETTSSFAFKTGVEETGTTSVMQTYFNMFKCFIGIGILATPAAIAKVGVVGGALGIIVCGCLNMYTMTL